MKNQVNIGLVGFGVVGSGTLQLLNEHRKDIEARVGAKLNVKWVCSRGKKTSKYITKGIRQTKNWKDVVNDPAVDCVVELIGGTDPAKQIVISAMQSGKHVVTANKAILAKFWNEIFNTAHNKSKLVYFEAAVGGGVPMVQALNEGLAGNKITKIIGILNGTTNFILTKMQEEGLDFKTALKQAQVAGFAEADPSFDLDGIDAGQKIAILGSLATGQWISPERVHCEGISDLQSFDLQVIEATLKSRVKLLGIAEETNKGWVCRVHPTLIKQTHPFANVRNEYNAISIHGNAVDDVMLYGKGAGKMATSSAVISDLIFLCRQIANGTAGRLPYVSARGSQKIRFGSMKDIRCKYYLRIDTLDKPGLLSQITGILGRHGVSIASVHQDASYSGANKKQRVPVILLTHACRESNIQASVKAINKLKSSLSKTVLLRME